MGKAKTRADTRIRLFEARDENHPRNATYEGIERFNGLEKERKHTDKPFIGCLILPHVFVLAFFYFMWITSDFNRLDHAADFRGDLCGKKGTTLENVPYAYYFDPVGVPDIAMCVVNCPTVAGQEICFYDVDGVTVMDDYCYNTIATRQVNQYCIPMAMGQNRTLVESYAYKDIEFYKRIAQSLFWGVDLTTVSLISMFLLGLLYNALIVHNKSRNQMFKFTLVMIFLFAAGFIYGVKLDIDWHLEKECLTPGVDDGCGGARVKFDNFLIYFIAFAMVVFYVYLFLNRKNIRLLLGNVRVLLRPLRQLKKTYLLVAVIFLFEIFAIQVFIFLYILTTTTGKTKIVAAPELFPNPTYAAIIHDDVYSNFIYVAIGLLIWWLGILQQFTRMVVCGIASNWYFAKEKTILDDPIISGVRFTMKYHLGSVIFSSVLTLLLWPYNVVLSYARKKIPKLNKKSRKFRFWMNSCTPFLIFYEEWTKYVSHKNLYQVMVFGEEYYNSGIRSFYLRFRNNSRLENLSKIIGYFTLIGKVFCTLGGATLLNLYMHYRYKNAWQKSMEHFEYPIAPSVIMLFVGFFATQTISSVMDITAECLQFCFVCDEEMYAGKQRFVDDEMTLLMNLHGTEAKNSNELEIHARPKVNDEVFQDYDGANINIPEPEPDDHDEEDKMKDDKNIDTPPEFAPANINFDDLEDESVDKKREEKTPADKFQDLAMDDLFAKQDPSGAAAKGKAAQEEKPFKINIPNFKSNDESSLFHGGAMSEENERAEPKKLNLVKGFSEVSGLDILGTSSRDVSNIEDSRAGDINKKLFNSSKLKIEEVGDDSEDEEDVDINKKDVVKRDGFVF